MKMPLQHRYHHCNQRGHGIGAVLKSLSQIVKPMFNSAKTNLIPLAKKVGKELKTEGATFLKDTGKDILTGQDVMSSINKNARKTKRRVVKKVKKKLGGKKRGGKRKKAFGGKRVGKRKGGKKRKGAGKKKVGGKRKRGRKKKVSLFDGY